MKFSRTLRVKPPRTAVLRKTTMPGFYDIVKKGKVVGDIRGKFNRATKDFYVDFVGGNAKGQGYHLGRDVAKDLTKHLSRMGAETVSGWRITGMRQKANKIYKEDPLGISKDYVITKMKLPKRTGKVLKFKDHASNRFKMAVMKSQFFSSGLFDDLMGPRN